jgi:hypothetical protein
MSFPPIWLQNLELTEKGTYEKIAFTIFLVAGYEFVGTLHITVISPMDEP